MGFWTADLDFRESHLKKVISRQGWPDSQLIGPLATHQAAMSQIYTEPCLDNFIPAGGVPQRYSCQWSCKGRYSSAAFSPIRPLESDKCLADVLQLLSSGGPSAALSVDIDCMLLFTVHGTCMQCLFCAEVCQRPSVLYVGRPTRLATLQIIALLKCKATPCSSHPAMLQQPTMYPIQFQQQLSDISFAGIWLFCPWP
ncbi:hypothetical protein WJX77_011816 [Trebouxia sp. C0004]